MILVSWKLVLNSRSFNRLRKHMTIQVKIYVDFLDGLQLIVFTFPSCNDLVTAARYPETQSLFILRHKESSGYYAGRGFVGSSGS